MLISELQDRCL